MEKQKIIKIICVTGILLFVYFLGLFSFMIFSESNYNDILSDSLDNYSKGKEVVFIDDKPIGKKYLNKRIKLYKKYIINNFEKNDIYLSDKILKKLIDNYIVLTECKKSNFFSNDQAQDYLWIYLEEAMVNYYLDFMVNLKKKEFSLKPEQINDFYNKNKKIFDDKKINKEQALLVIQEQLLNINEKVKNKNNIVFRKIELGKLKKNKKIKIVK